MKKERHEISLSNPLKPEIDAPQRHRGRPDNPQARVKRLNNHTRVRLAAKNMRKRRALCGITELNTGPAHVCFPIAISNGVAPNIIAVTLRGGMGWKTPLSTGY